MKTKPKSGKTPAQYRYLIEEVRQLHETALGQILALTDRGIFELRDGVWHRMKVVDG